MHNITCCNQPNCVLIQVFEQWWHGALIQFIKLSTKVESVKSSGSITCQDVGTVSSMDWAYYGNHDFNEQVEYWGVSQVINMKSMFYIASSSKQPIGSWNVIKVTDMGSMVRHASSSNQTIVSVALLTRNPGSGRPAVSTNPLIFAMKEALHRVASSFLEFLDTSTVTDVESKLGNQTVTFTWMHLSFK